MYQRYVKRIVDAVLSFFALAILWPFFLLIAVIIKLDSPGPVFFKQKRVGQNKNYFMILKFRTMRADTPKDVPTHLLQDARSCITPVGHFLRNSSLDELPQIINILSGKMSIIGPRPALWNQDNLIAERDKYGANCLVPGLTGYAQINGRDELPIPLKAELDGYYAQHISFGLDVKIFFRTILSVFKGSGVVEGQQQDQSKENSNKKDAL